MDSANWSSEEFVKMVLQVARMMPTIVPQTHLNGLEVECRRFHILDDMSQNYAGDDIETTWVKIAQSSEFPELCHLALATLTLFHGNADVERTNCLIKNPNLTDKRNRLSVTTLTALIRIKMFLQVLKLILLTLKKH